MLVRDLLFIRCYSVLIFTWWIMAYSIHAIKTLPRYSKLETRMIYLHLHECKQLGIVSPHDELIVVDDVSVHYWREFNHIKFRKPRLFL